MIIRAVLLLLWCAFPVCAATLQIVPGAYSSGKAYTSCVVDGAREHCFLDSGSAMTLVANSKRFASYTNLGGLRFKSATGIAQETETIRVRSIQIGDVSYRDVRIARATFRGAENTLGIDILGRQPFALTFKNRSHLQLNAARPELPLTTLNVSDQGLLSIPITIGESETRALWDTGAALTTIDRALISAQPDNFRGTKSYVRGVDGAGKSLLLQVFRAKKITIADRTFDDVRVVAIDLSLLRQHISGDIQAVVGFNLIRKGNWFFDAKKRLWKCEG